MFTWNGEPILDMRGVGLRCREGGTRELSLSGLRANAEGTRNALALRVRYALDNNSVQYLG